MCSTCPALISVGETVLRNGSVLLSEAFQSAFPDVTHSAKQYLLQLPLVALRVGHLESGLSQIYLFEYFPHVNYHKFLSLLNNVLGRHSLSSTLKISWQ